MTNAKLGTGPCGEPLLGRGLNSEVPSPLWYLHAELLGVQSLVLLSVMGWLIVILFALANPRVLFVWHTRILVPISLPPIWLPDPLLPICLFFFRKGTLLYLPHTWEKPKENAIKDLGTMKPQVCCHHLGQTGNAEILSACRLSTVIFQRFLLWKRSGSCFTFGLSLRAKP